MTRIAVMQKIRESIQFYQLNNNYVAIKVLNQLLVDLGHRPIEVKRPNPTKEWLSKILKKQE